MVQGYCGRSDIKTIDKDCASKSHAHQLWYRKKPLTSFRRRRTWLSGHGARPLPGPRSRVGAVLLLSQQRFTFPTPERRHVAVPECRKQSRAECVPDQRHQDQTVDARTILEPVAASDRFAFQTVQRAERSVQPDDFGQRRLLLRRRPVHRRLATIYKSSELHLLQDRSQGYDDTWSFVKRAVEECVKLDTMLESNAQLAKDVVTASVSTAKNILGLSWNR